MKKINKIFLELYNDRKQLLTISFLCYIMYLIENTIPSDPGVVQCTGWVAGAIVVGTLISTVGGHMANKGNRDRRKSEEGKFDELRETYEETEFETLDRDALRRENVFKGQENIMEDMEVDNQAADYAKEQFQQQQANIMQGLRGSAGASGTAGLAQALSGQASKQAQQSQITIGQQLQQNRRMQLQEQARINQQELTEESRLSQEDRAVQIANLEGARQFEVDKLTTMMGMSGSKIAGVNQQIAQTQQTYSQIGSAVTKAASAFGGGTGTGGGGTGGSGAPKGTTTTWDASYAPGYGPSDRRLKKDINLIGKSPSGLNIYSFEFKDSKNGEGVFQGVMSDEVPKNVVTKKDGYDMVDYSKLDVEFKQI